MRLLKAHTFLQRDLLNLRVRWTFSLTIIYSQKTIHLMVHIDPIQRRRKKSFNEENLKLKKQILTVVTTWRTKKIKTMKAIHSKILKCHKILRRSVIEHFTGMTTRCLARRRKISKT